MKKQSFRPGSRRQPRGARFRPQRFKSKGFSFKREAKWMTAMNLAPFGIGVVLALIFWFTR